MKKIFIISIALLGVTLFFLGIYNIAFKKAPAPVVQAPAIQEAPAKKEVVQAIPVKKPKITAVSKEPVLGVFVDKKAETVTYYSATDGTVWQVNVDGTNRTQIVDTKLAGLKNVIWSIDGTKVLSEFNKDGKIVFYTYDYSKKAGQQLKDGLDSAVWDSVGTRIIYKYYDDKTKERTLNVANADGSNWKKIADVPYKNLLLSAVPLSSVVSFWETPDAGKETQFQTVGIGGGSIKTLLRGRFGADYLWSPNGTLAIVSSLASKESKMISLGTVTADGTYADLNIPTLASKCVWSTDNKIVFYALPGGIPDGSIMPNDYDDKKFTTEDTFWKIDVTTGKKDRIIDPNEIGGKYDSADLHLSPTQDALFFTNRIDGKLYRMAL